MASVNINQISKRYGETTVLKGVSLDIRDGEFLTLIGPSGCGKSTLLRILAGLEAQDSGHIELDGENIDTRRPSERDVAMVFQSYALYPHFTVFDNIALPLRMQRLSRTQRLPLLGSLMPARKGVERTIATEVNQVAKILNIDHLLQRKPGQLSGGQRQRVALGRAMVRHPKIFLMDEPLSNLDAKLRVQMRAEIVALHRRLGVTFVYVTHDQAEAMTMSDRVAVMVGGDVLQIAPPEELYRNPAEIRVAELIGSPKINILTVDDITWALKYGFAAAHRIGFRPEAASIVASGTGMLEGVVSNVENFGADIFLHIDLKDAETIIVRRDPHSPRLSPGNAVGIMLDLRQILAFDADGKQLMKEERIAV
ncbi:ABC transporter ATP-binding protein [Samsonia erythrinae]|uniref:Carbohydrate ABC transporter ATP-binding protein (CUT1 family) n=1 Tax=Samsonia erythrinae TaxID=160434 RepID=A0A4R3VGX1_9GAMM|nr:ABC transporter ATP-binding protein [Samsonia erythrinae]TCV04736.1 carbohydrate ABC transporter ATP-binding protein (CUT1 family) [Samsonia erythrinae]